MDESGETAIEGGDCMKDTRFDALLAASRPKNFRRNDNFTDTVMSKIKSSEILSSQIRKTSVKQNKILGETLFMKLRHLPKLAVIAIAAGALVLVSGSAFAAYQLLWPKPEVHVSQPTTSTGGRQEVAISYEKCGSNTLASRYELKSNATISIDEVPGVVKAQCELGAIGEWAENTFPHDARFAPMNTNKEYDSVGLSTSMATHIKTRSDTSVTFVGLTKYMQEDVTLDVTPGVRFIVDGHDATAADISVDDPIVYITSETRHMVQSPDCTSMHCSISSTSNTRKLLAVVKLSSEFKFYDQFAWQSLTERATCQGNPNDTCLSGYIGGIDLYMGNATMTLDDKTVQMKEIQGVVTALNGASTTIRSSSGTLFTIVTPSDVVNAYNTQKAAKYYNNQTVGIGSSIVVSYIEKIDQYSRTLNATNLISVYLRTEQVGKSDPVNAY